MTRIREIIDAIEELAPLSLQESYDNAGVQVCGTAGAAGNESGLDAECTGVLVCLDITEDVIAEAVSKACNLVVSHHPLIFSPLRKVAGDSLPERCVMAAIRGGVTLYSAHTNLDNAPCGVNFKIAQKLGLENLEGIGTGLVGELPEALDEAAFLEELAGTFDVACIQHSSFLDKPVKKVALCGGSGAFLIADARAAGADCFVTGEISYHHYFEADDILLVALGHYQSEQYTKDLLRDHLSERFEGLAVEMTSINTNPVSYFVK